MKDKALIAIMGPTASGKSEIAIEIAQKIPSEIISADSMQLYKGMDIGTAKPSEDEQKLIAHHLISLFDISRRVEVFTYVKLAEDAIKSIWSRNRIPILVGGSGMYIKALLYGLDNLPSDYELSSKLYDKYENNISLLRFDLQKIDPEAEEAFQDKPRKMIRAMEIFILTGKSILKQNTQWNAEKLKYLTFAYKIKRERKELYERITLRTDKMLASGWIEETSRLLDQGLESSPTAKQAIGYNHIGKYISGQISFEEVRVRIIADTKKYVRRQETWFKNQHPEAKELKLPEEKDDFFKEIISKVNNSVI